MPKAMNKSEPQIIGVVYAVVILFLGLFSWGMVELCTEVHEYGQAELGKSFLPELLPHQEALIQIASDCCVPYLNKVFSNDLIAPQNILELLIENPESVGDLEAWEEFANLAINPRELYGRYIIPGSFADESICAWDALTGHLSVTYRYDLNLRQSKFCYAPSLMRVINSHVFPADARGVNLGMFDRKGWDHACGTVLRHEIMEYGDGMSQFERDIFLDKEIELFESHKAKNTQSASATWSHVGCGAIIAELSDPDVEAWIYRLETREILPITKALSLTAYELGVRPPGYLACDELLFKIKSDPRLLLRFRAALSSGYAELAKQLAGK